MGGGPAALGELIRLSRKFSNVGVVSDSFGGGMGILGDMRLQSSLAELTLEGAPASLQEYMSDRTAISPTGAEYTNYIRDCIEKLKVQKVFAKVKSIGKGSSENQFFADAVSVSGVAHRLRARSVILATGVKPKEPASNILLCPWVSCFQTYEMLSMGKTAYFRGKSVAIIGSGNTAYQLAHALTRVAKDVTLLIRGYVGVYPVEVEDRFALRAQSVLTLALVAKSAEMHTCGGPLNPSSSLLSRVWLHVYDALSVDVEQGAVCAQIPPPTNQHRLLKASVVGAVRCGSLRPADDGGYIWRRPIADTVVISAIGVTADVPELQWQNLTVPKTGYIKHVAGETAVDGLYVAGGAAGYASVNEMIPVSA